MDIGEIIERGTRKIEVPQWFDPGKVPRIAPPREQPLLPSPERRRRERVPEKV